jgi:hypothetical protein
MAMNIFPFIAAFVLLDSSSDSDSSTSSSSDSDSDDDEWYLDAMMHVVEQELLGELEQEHEPEPYNAEPGRPRTLEDGIARLTEDNVYHFTRFSKDQIRYPLPKIGSQCEPRPKFKMLEGGVVREACEGGGAGGVGEDWDESRPKSPFSAPNPRR